MLLKFKHRACPACWHADQMEIVALSHVDHDPYVCPFRCAACCMFGNAAFLFCRFDPATADINDLKRLLTFSSKFVNSLHLQQLPSHLDLQVIFDAMRRWDRSLPSTVLQKHLIMVSCILVTVNDAPMEVVVSLCNLLKVLHAPFCSCKHIWHLLLHTLHA